MSYKSDRPGIRLTGPLIRKKSGLAENNPCYSSAMIVSEYALTPDGDTIVKIGTPPDHGPAPDSIVLASTTDVDPITAMPDPMKVRCNPQPKSTDHGPDGAPVCTCYAWTETDCISQTGTEIVCLTCSHDPVHTYGTPGAVEECHDTMPGFIGMYSGLPKPAAEPGGTL